MSSESSSSSEPTSLIKESPRIFIAKSDLVYAEALRTICNRVFLHAETTLLTTGRDVLSALTSKNYDYGIFGLRFPDTDGVDLLQQVSQKRLVKNLLIVAEQSDRPILPNLHTSRIDAIIDTFGESQNALRTALRQVSKGQVYVSPSLRPYLVERHSSLALRQALTPAELRVLRIIGTGSDNLDTSVQLGLSIGTVQTHRRSIMRKFKVSTSSKMVFEAIRQGFVQTDALPDPEPITTN